MESDEKIASHFPYAKLVLVGAGYAKNLKRLRTSRSFFEVAKLGLLDDLKIPGIAYRNRRK